MRTRLLFMTSELAAAALIAAGCGDDDDSDDNGGGSGGAAAEQATTESGGGGGGGGATQLELVADPGGDLKFDKTSLSATAGEVTVVMDNPSDVPHAVEIEGGGVDEATDTVTGATSEVTVELEAGEYVFYCPVGNHRQAGMEGTLTVN